MAGEKNPGTSSVEAVPEASERAKPDAPKPGTTPGTSEVDATPDRPVPADERPKT